MINVSRMLLSRVTCVVTCGVQVLAAGNLGGRIGWAAFSDKFGRKLTFNMFCLGSIPLYLAVPYTVQQVVGTGVSGFLCSFSC